MASVLSRLLDNPEFLGALAAYRLGRLASLMPGLVRSFVRYRLAREVRGVSDVRSIQVIIERYMTRMIEAPRADSAYQGWTSLSLCDPTFT